MLAVTLARDCISGCDVTIHSTRSGHGEDNVDQQLDPEKMKYIKSIVAGRVGKNVDDPEFELVWSKCLVSIGKQCQRLRKNAVKGQN